REILPRITRMPRMGESIAENDRRQNGVGLRRRVRPASGLIWRRSDPDAPRAAEHRRTPRRKRELCARNGGHVVECGGAPPLFKTYWEVTRVWSDGQLVIKPTKKPGTFVTVFTCTRRLVLLPVAQKGSMMLGWVRTSSFVLRAS